MKIYKKAVIVAAKEIPDSLPQEQIKAAEHDFEENLSLVVNRMRVDWFYDFDHKWGIYDVEDSADGRSEKEKLEAAL